MNESHSHIEWVTKFAARYWTECRSSSEQACMARAREAHKTMGAMDPFKAANRYLEMRRAEAGGPLNDPACAVEPDKDGDR